MILCKVHGLLFIKVLFFLFSLGINKSFAQDCDIIGEWHRINEDNDTITIIFEKDRVSYLVNGRKMVPSNGFQNSDDDFANHDLRKFRFKIGTPQDVELYSDKIFHQATLNFRFITCDKLLLILLTEQKEAVFFRGAR